MASGRRLAFGTLRSPLLADPETASTLGSTWYRKFWPRGGSSLQGLVIKVLSRCLQWVPFCSLGSLSDSAKA